MALNSKVELKVQRRGPRVTFTLERVSESFNWCALIEIIHIYDFEKGERGIVHLT